VTDRCNIRCFYCMPADQVSFLDRRELLTFEEIERVVRIAVSLGVSKVRLTGGEPLVRRGLPDLVRSLAAIPGLQDLGLTTNGILLEGLADSLFAAGLRRINVSLDALSPDLFRQVTRREGYEQVLAGIQAAQRVGLGPVKINAVSIRGLTDSQIVPFGRFARDTGCEIRFIEYMPLDADCQWERDKVLFAEEILEVFARELMPLVPLVEARTDLPSRDYQFADGIGRIGFIPSVSEPFCDRCNRFRLTSDGKLRNCLFSLEEQDLRSLLRGGGTDQEIVQAIRRSISEKWAGHQINSPEFTRPDRAMYSIGG